MFPSGIATNQAIRAASLLNRVEWADGAWAPVRFPTPSIVARTRAARRRVSRAARRIPIAMVRNAKKARACRLRSVSTVTR